MLRVIQIVLVLTLFFGSGVNASLFDIWHDTDFDGAILSHTDDE